MHNWEKYVRLDKTNFYYFKKFCIKKFGADIGNLINVEAESKLSEMIKEADYRSSKYIKWHMDKNMLPSIAIYLTFKEFKSIADKAYDYTDEVLQIYRLKNRRKNLAIGRLPFGYFAFKIFCRSVVKKQYPEQGWNMEWIQYNKNEIHFNMKSCIYFETTKKYNCTEMCQLFCANDDVILTGYNPAIVFERKGTIAQGQNICDFHFKNRNYTKRV